MSAPDGSEEEAAEEGDEELQGEEGDGEVQEEEVVEEVAVEESEGVMELTEGKDDGSGAATPVPTTANALDTALSLIPDTFGTHPERLAGADGGEFSATQVQMIATAVTMMEACVSDELWDIMGSGVSLMMVNSGMTLINGPAGIDLAGYLAANQNMMDRVKALVVSSMPLAVVTTNFNAAIRQELRELQTGFAVKPW
jgi:hypothetical protein